MDEIVAGPGQPRAFEPREGGVKIVFDVPEQDVPEVTGRVAAAGFDVRRYYRPDAEHRRGGSRPGYVRLGAEKPLSEFAGIEQDRIVAEFDAIQREVGFACVRIGVDSWVAGGADPTAGDREPRVPLPSAGSGSAYVLAGEDAGGPHSA